MTAALENARRARRADADPGATQHAHRDAAIPACLVRSVPTPLGPLVLAAHGTAVAALTWSRGDLARLGLREGDPGAADLLPARAWLEAAEAQLREYFAGRRTAFDLPFDLRGTSFQRQVWNELRNIPYGATWSYRELAERVGRPAAVRAVGSANGRNPACIFIPCHRVVRTGGELGGYAGGLERKAFLLDLEGRGR